MKAFVRDAEQIPKDYESIRIIEGYNHAFIGGSIDDCPWAGAHEPYEESLWLEGFKWFSDEQSSLLTTPVVIEKDLD